jgi:hypothetical protein
MSEITASYLVGRMAKGAFDTVIVIFLTFTVSSIYIFGASALACLLEIMHAKSLQWSSDSILRLIGTLLPLDVWIDY